MNTVSDDPKPNIREEFLGRVRRYLPSESFSSRITASSSAPVSQMAYSNRIALVGSAHCAQRLSGYCSVEALHPDDTSSLDWAGMDALILIGRILSYQEPWRRALLDLENEGAKLRRLCGVARSNGVPVVLWIQEEPDATDTFSHLFDDVDQVIVANEAQAKDSKTTFVAPDVDVKTFNPVVNDLQRAHKRFSYIPFLVDGLFDMAVGYESDGLLDWLSPLFDYNWWATDSSYDLRNNDHKLDAIVRRRFLGSLRGTAIRTPLQLARAQILPAPMLEKRPRWTQEAALRAAACKTLTLTDAAEVPLPEAGMIAAPSQDSLAAAARSILEDEVATSAAQHRAWRYAMTHRTLFESLAAVLASVGVRARLNTLVSPHVNIVVPTIRPELVPFVIANAKRQSHPNTSLTIVCNGRPIPPQISALVADTPNAEMLYLPADKSIGYCINYAIDHCPADYWAKFDDDDIYGVHYLSDLLLQRKYSDFDVTGKAAIFTYFEEGSGLHIRRLTTRDSYLHTIGGGTLLTKSGSGVFPEDVRGYADTLFLADLAERGKTILAGDPFNFVQVRRADPKSHTWTAGRGQLNLRGPSRSGMAFENVLI